VLRNDPAAVEHVHRRYSRVVAATCQGSRDQTISDPHRRGDRAEFEVVIVDEAARATPLDLMIPLSAARGQVVLVGDHRQLPHLLNLELEGELATSTAVTDALRESTFERLFESLRRQSARDGVPRVVTLDLQFRMHPRLGTFVNETFYEPHGEQVRNGIEAEQRTHDVPRYAARVAHWEDVPFSRGIEKGRVHREAEAATAVDLLQDAADTGSPALTLAIVTFYAEQLEWVIKTCVQRGLGVGSRRDFRFVGGLAERAFVGTVDAFQGREFDIVILSLGRSNNYSIGAGARAGRRRYGFLTIENRACVAMSRARRLLLVAGDRNYASNANAQKWIRPFAELVKLCDAELGKAHGQAA